MPIQFQKLPQLQPVKFPNNSGKKKIVYKLTGTQGRPTNEIIAEMKRLSKQNIYVSE